MKKGNIIFASFFLIVLIYLYYLTTKMRQPLDSSAPGPAYAPKLYIILGIILTIIIIYNSFKESNIKKFNLDKYFYLYLILIIIYTSIINIIGFYLATTLFLVTVFYILGIRKWQQVSLIIVSFLVFVFVVFDLIIDLPIP